MVAIDLPPAGIHIYTAKAKYVGQGKESGGFGLAGRFFAYELRR
jgi:hypothetical protein